jgi:stage III sporulation protein SpoIIIAA
VVQILARRTKNNPILLGEPGVGKTAIAEGLAYAIVQGCHSDGTPLPVSAARRGARVLVPDPAGPAARAATAAAAAAARAGATRLAPAHPSPPPSLPRPRRSSC